MFLGSKDLDIILDYLRKRDNDTVERFASNTCVALWEYSAGIQVVPELICNLSIQAQPVREDLGASLGFVCTAHG